MSKDRVRDIADGTIISIKFPRRMKNWLFEQKKITGKPVSAIVREAVEKEMRTRDVRDRRR